MQFKFDFTFKGCIYTNTRFLYDMANQISSHEATFNDCQIRCQQTSGCSFFSWRKDSKCHLHGPTAMAISSPGVISGLKYCDAGTFDIVFL